MIIYNDGLHRPNPGQHRANPPYGTPNHSRLWYSLDSNQGVCSDASSTEMQCLRPLRPIGWRTIGPATEDLTPTFGPQQNWTRFHFNILYTFLFNFDLPRSLSKKTNLSQCRLSDHHSNLNSVPQQIDLDSTWMSSLTGYFWSTVAFVLSMLLLLFVLIEKKWRQFLKGRTRNMSSRKNWLQAGCFSNGD